jgi:hypothetical protein
MKRLPIEFASLGLDIDRFSYSDKKSFRGPCPMCGGTRRFVMFVDHDWPLNNGYCDQCAHTVKAWLKFPSKITDEQRQHAREQAEQHDKERAEVRRVKLAEFTTRELWEELSERMTLEHIDWWDSQGIPESIQRYLRLGYLADKFYWEGRGGDKIERHSPAYTIPWFGKDFTFKTMQYRLTNPSNPKDRYRFEDGLGGGEHYYMVDPAEPIKDKVIICEGVKKAVVGWHWLSPSDDFTWLAASSANTFSAALEATKDCDLRYVILDPGADAWTQRAVATNPRTTHAVRLPYKLDDGFLQYGLDRDIFGAILKTAL